MDNSSTDLTTCEVVRLASLSKNFDTTNINSIILDDGPNGVLYTPTMEIREASYNKQYVLLPDGNNYKIIREYINNVIAKTSLIV